MLTRGFKKREIEKKSDPVPKYTSKSITIDLFVRIVEYIRYSRQFLSLKITSEKNLYQVFVEGRVRSKTLLDVTSLDPGFFSGSSDQDPGFF